MPPPPAPRPPAPCPASPVFSQRAPLLWMRAPHRVALAPQVHKGYMSKAEKVALLDDLAPHLQLVVKVLGSRAAELEGKGSKGEGKPNKKALEVLEQQKREQKEREEARPPPPPPARRK